MKHAIRMIPASAALFALTGCFGSSSTQFKDVEEAMMSSPYVEAYIEFTGPDSKWSGPMTVVMHVDAREDSPKITVTPELRSKTRKPEPGKGVDKPENEPLRRLAAASALTSRQAREQLTELAAAMEDTEGNFDGCLYPVRARLVRADGATVEGKACRGRPHGGTWAGMASQLFGRLYTD